MIPTVLLLCALFLAVFLYLRSLHKRDDLERALTELRALVTNERRVNRDLARSRELRMREYIEEIKQLKAQIHKEPTLLRYKKPDE